MKYTYIIASLLMLITGGEYAAAQPVRNEPAAQSPASYVNPFIGASTSVGQAGIYHGLGKTFPGAATPFGMVQVSPNTITGGDNGSGFSYEHTSIEGFAVTQLSGIGWFGDLGNFLVMPSTGRLKTNRGDGLAATGSPARAGYRSAYDPSKSVASAGYYQAFLQDYGVKAELTAAPHTAMMRFTYPASDSARIQIDLARRVGGTSTEQSVTVVNDSTIEGWIKCTPDGGGWGDGDGHADYTVYFQARFSRPFKSSGVWSAAIPDTASRHKDNVVAEYYQQWIRESRVEKNIRQKQGKHLGFFADYATRAGEQIMLKVGVSFTSAEAARANLAGEIPHGDFDRVRREAVAAWDTALGKVAVTGGTTEEKTVFYTALYHSMLDPRTMQDLSGSYVSSDKKVHQSAGFTKRTVFSGWDVFRSQMPLQSILNPSVVNDMVNSLIEIADHSGRDYLERWELLNAYTGCMIGNPAIPVIADAYFKGIRNFDINRAFSLSVNSVEKFGNGARGYSTGIGISHTLEYAFTESCVADLARALGRNEQETLYRGRAQSYRNIWDDSVHWFRPRNEDGSWQAWPEKGRLTQGYGSIESNPLQQGWFVPHDLDGLFKLMGGRQKVRADLTAMFNATPENMMWNDYYNHANEPVHHVPFLFNRVGAPWLTQKWTRLIARQGYHNGVEGLVGNEDVGQMSAWYALTAMGFHPVTPGKTRYELTSPVFNKIVIKLDPTYATGKTFTIVARNNSPKNLYIQRATLNGKPWNRCYIEHAQIVSGGMLELEMGSTPNQKWGLAE